ncbi:hypothetical protein COPEUT_02102 [Coprococcus eutactus ATCC 27759]|nr:hypothetical protein COPEUT_02102 [Coprococcus eutactus ATCC 27759]
MVVRGSFSFIFIPIFIFIYTLILKFNDSSYYNMY